MNSNLIGRSDLAEMRDLQNINAISRSDVAAGDRIVIQTANSTYLVEALSDKEFLVSGGWFDRNDLSPYVSNIHGCTMGSSAIYHNLLAAIGLCIEFDNQVTTSPITEISILRKDKVV